MNIKKILLLLITLGVLLSTGYFVTNYFTTKKELSEYKDINDVQAIKEKNDILERLNKTLIIPQDEDPTLATVTDAFRLRGQKFFEQAKNGDKVLVFANAQRAVLYRPSDKKVIEYAPVNLTDFNKPSAQIEASQNYVLETEGDTAKEPDTSIEEEPKSPAKLAIYNGTLFITGLATDLSDYLEKEIGKDNIKIELVTNADDIYEKTVLIDVSGNHSDVANQIVTLLDAQTVEKIEGVNFPDVDIIIIAGKNIDLGKIR